MKYLAGLLFSAVLGATSLTGTMNGPDGTGLTGTLSFNLSQQAALKTTGSCGGPKQIMPTVAVNVTVTAGALGGSPSLFGNDCLLPANTYYNVTFKDRTGNIIMTDRWQLTGSSVDIGTIVSVVVTGTTATLGSTGVVVSAPAGAQTVTQPSTTTLTINDLTAGTKFTVSGILICASGTCTFTSGTFNNGIVIGHSSSSDIYVGAGQFINHTFSGNVSCAGKDDGYQGISVDLHQLQFCVGGTRFVIQGI